MNIKIICIGKIKEKYLVDGILEYSKRLKLFCDLEILELKETNTDDINKNIEPTIINLFLIDFFNLSNKLFI